MTDMPKITGSNTGAPTGAQSSEAPKTSVTFEDALKGALSVEQFALVQPFIGQLPPIEGKTPEEAATLYAAAIKNLVEKQAAFSGNAGSVLTQWVNALQSQSTVASGDPFAQSNQVLSGQFQDWFSQQLTSQLDSYLPTGVVSKFNFVLGSVASQADQIGSLSPSALKVKTGEIKEFIDGLKKHLDSDIPKPGETAGKAQIRKDSLPFLRSAFGSLANRSLMLSEIKDSEFLLKADKFSQKVSEQLVKQLKDVGVELSTDGANKIAAKIKWTPGMSETQLQSAVKEMVTQLKGQFEKDYKADASTRLKAVIDAEVTRLGKAESKAVSLSVFFADIAVSLTNLQIQAFYTNKDIKDEQKPETHITADQVKGIKEHVERDTRDLFEKMMRGEPVEPAFKDRYTAMVDNLKTLTARLKRITPEEVAKGEIIAGHIMTARDLLSVVDASIANRFDEQVLFSLNERRVNRLEKRDQQKTALQDLTMRLKLYGVIQSTIHSAQSKADGKYHPGGNYFKASDFGYTEAQFKDSPEYKYLKKRWPDDDKVYHIGFLSAESVPVDNKEYQDTKDNKYLANFSSAVSDKSKLLNDEVQIKTTELNDTSSQYNSTVEAMNKFVQKYHSILEQILRAI